ncbi:hypothetical protein B0H17DRAFT_199572 [Mycena rosella]|uniref:Uncharacterized protein n=1 Tax=Mycena rosella TaxID=1033263 RepID=A0AAD7DYT2_MYCRO|nr:hypothetical protein B0H17DRAFT_199572 [Mycena rosella]
MAQVIAYRAMKKRGIRATNKAAAMDAQQTATKIGELLLDLFERMGVRGFAVMSRGHPDDAALPHAVDSDRVMSSFFVQQYKLSSLDVLRTFESHSCAMDDGGKEKNDIATMRKQVIDWQRDAFRKVCKDKSANISYEHYDHKIRELRGCEIVGWPEQVTWRRPSMMDVQDIRTILNGLKNGAIFWRRMKTADHTEFVEQQVEARRLSGAPARRRRVRSDKGVARKGKGRGREGEGEEGHRGEQRR